MNPQCFIKKMENKNIEIKLIDRVTQNTVSGHHELIRQVLMNIFDNFTKYGKRGHPVEVDQRIQKSSGMAIIEIKGLSEHPLIRRIASGLVR